MSTTSITLAYAGSAGQVDIYNDGALAVHTLAAGKGAITQAVSASKGVHTLRSNLARKLTLLGGGAVTLSVNKAKAVALKPGVSVDIPAAATFVLTAKDAAVLQVVAKVGPEYEGTSEQENKLRP